MTERRPLVNVAGDIKELPSGDTLPGAVLSADAVTYGNGSTSATTHIQGLIDTAAAAGGGYVFLPEGVYIHGGLTMKSNVHLYGAGEWVTILRLANGSNVDCILGENFSSLTGTGSVAGIQDWSIMDLSIEGNRLNQTGTPAGIKVYGFSFEISRVTVRDCLGRGIWTEWDADNGPGTSHNGMESRITDVHVTKCGGAGYYILGPHDSIYSRCYSISNEAEGFYALNSGLSGGGGTKFTDCHSWGNQQTYAFRLACSAHVLAAYAEGAIIANVLIEAGTGNFNGFVLGAGASAPVGIEVGAGSPVSGWMIHANIRDCTTAALKYTNDSENEYNCYVYQTSGTVHSGTVGTASRLVVTAAGQSATVNIQQSRNTIRGTTTLRASGGSAFLVKSPTQDVFNVNTSNSRLDVLNGYSVRFWSDAYTTETVDIAAATGRITWGDNLGGPVLMAGAGTPESAVTAPPGSVYLRNNGTAGTTTYIKETGSGNTGWKPLLANGNSAYDLVSDSLLEATCSSNISINSTAVSAITGMSISFTSPSTAAEWMITSQLDLETLNTNSALLLVYPQIDTVDLGTNLCVANLPTPSRVPLPGSWKLTGVAAGARTMRLVGTCTGTTNGYDIIQTHSRVFMTRLK